MAHDPQALWIAAVLRDVGMYPVDGLGDVADDGPHVHTGQESVFGGDEDEPVVREHLRLELDVRLVAALPTPAVNPEDHRQVSCLWRCIDIEYLALVRFLD